MKKIIIIILIAAVLLIALAPLFILPGAGFEGTDGKGSEMISEVIGEEYEPWFDPVLERLIGGELPAEMETLFFCIQTGIGVGVLAYCFGYLAARKKFSEGKLSDGKSLDKKFSDIEFPDENLSVENLSEEKFSDAKFYSENEA